jgi:energy-coupling factor transporter ATP-binding protein EcfA2
MSQLPVPRPGGSLEQFRGFTNVASEDDWRLLMGWLLSAARPTGQPYPILGLHGEQGSGKSTTARLLRDLLDPNSAPLRAAPRNERDLMIAANAGWVLSFDNLSGVQGWLSDALCRLATGGGFATRELYSDEAERIFAAQRPIILTGIGEVTTRSDLLDRSILVTLPAIGSRRRLDERSFRERFEQARPQILGALYDGLSGALANIETTQIDELPRMADMALWVTAAEQRLGWSRGSFLSTYNVNHAQSDELALAASPIGASLRTIAEGGFDGPATVLLEQLNGLADETTRQASGWPTRPHQVGTELRRLAPNLRALGYHVEIDRTKKGRSIALYRSANAVTTVTAVTDKVAVCTPSSDASGPDPVRPVTPVQSRGARLNRLLRRRGAR